MPKSDVDKLLDRVQAILTRQGRTLADLSRELYGKKTGALNSAKYNQLYYWIRLRRYKPKGETILRLLRWIKENGEKTAIDRE